MSVCIHGRYSGETCNACEAGYGERVYLDDEPAAPPPPATDEEIVERVAQWIAKNLMRYAWDGLSEGRCGEQFPAFSVGGHANARKENYRDAARAVLAIAAPHYTQQGWEKGREQALKPLRGWRESDWPAGFCRWTAQTLADHVVERVRTMKQET